MAQTYSLDRREFLKTSAATGVALIIGFRLDGRAATDPAQAQEKPVVNPLNAWVRITPDNRVTLILGKSEMGQGVMTALPMILAEESLSGLERRKDQQAATDAKVYDLGTGGSGSVAGSWLPLRQAGAAAREMLITAAAARWNIGSGHLRRTGRRSAPWGAKNFLTYGELAAEASKLPVPDVREGPARELERFHDYRQGTRGESRAKGNKVDGAANLGCILACRGCNLPWWRGVRFSAAP